MGRYDIQVQNAKYDLIEILINEQTKHDSAVYAVGVASPFYRTAVLRLNIRERSSAISAW
jgi:hypothetical protein